MPGVLILGAIWGASAGPAGIGPLQAVVMSAIVWSGAGQYAALPLWPQGAPIVAISVLLLSLRFALMATSIVPLVANAPGALRALVAFTITDETYALLMTRRGGAIDPWYLLGAWLPLYLPWLVGTALGVTLASSVPTQWRGPLEAIFPIVFLTLTVLVCTSRTHTLVAILGAALSVVFALLLPPGWNVLLAGLVASSLGLLVPEKAR